MADVNGPLVSTEWLADALGRDSIAILDATWFLPGGLRDAKSEFAARHVPGAVFFDIDAISDRSNPLPHMLPSPAEFATAARRLGVNGASTVVVYDALGLFSAPRVWWTFRVMGHDRTYVLDGGLPKWLAEGRPTESGWPAPPHGEFKAHFRPDLVRDRLEVASALASSDEQLIDARPAARFHGDVPEPRPGLRGGHMPGARNLPYDTLVSDSGDLKPPAALIAAFEDAAIDLDRPIVASCGSGISAAILALALARLGRADAAVYDGSWAEWGSRDDTAVVTAEA